ncbi:hypothetical protein MMC07_007817 [Pseudocyphellaria aurata]|nr:hypothetical protein [Pseudocyphellaria aurata]
MSVGFGFSVGDLITSLKLIKDSVEAVKDTKGAATDYAQLLTEITSLQDGLEAIGDLGSVHKGSNKQLPAINRAVGACRKCVDDFLTSISKYQPHLHPNASGLTSNYRKIKWALCKKDNVATFRAQLERHTSSINMLLITFQTKETMESKGGDGSTTMVVKARDVDRDSHTATTLGNMSIEQRQFFELLIQQNKELMQNVEELKQMLHIQMSIPPQVLLQQPVRLLDAFGKMVPFHLDFIDSLEAFIAVLKVRFRQSGVKPHGLLKLEKREFFIQETRSKKIKDLSRPWSTIFQPGQEVDMSMVFHRMACRPGTCPGCSSSNEGGKEQTLCPECGLWHQDVEAIVRSYAFWGQSSSSCSPLDRADDQYVIQHPGWNSQEINFEIPEDSFEIYRRVQVYSHALASQMVQVHPQRWRQIQVHLQHLLVDSTPYGHEIRQLQARINYHVAQGQNMPASSSLSLTEHMTNIRAHQLTQDIYRLEGNMMQDYFLQRKSEGEHEHEGTDRGQQ